VNIQENKPVSNITCITGLRLIHELTARKGQHIVIRLDLEAFDGQTALDSYNAFSVGPLPGYRLHVGTRNSSYNLNDSKLLVCNFKLLFVI